MNNVALVTGGTGFLGKIIVRYFASFGYDVAFTYREKGDEAVSIEHELEKTGTRSLAIFCDFTKDHDFDDFLISVERRIGDIDVLILSASAYPGGDAGGMEEERVKKTFKVNIESQFLLATAMARRMKSLGGGRIMFLLDTAGEKVFSKFLPYSISKAAGYAMVKGLAKTYAPEVLVNGVSPGIIRAPDFLDEGELGRLLTKIPAGRFGMADEVAKTLLFLAQAPSYITGEIIGVDGGYGL